MSGRGFIFSGRPFVCYQTCEHDSENEWTNFHENWHKWPRDKRRFFYIYEILVDFTLTTRRIGEQKCSCLQFASSAHNVASEVMETLMFLYKFSIDMNDIVVLFLSS